MSLSSFSSRCTHPPRVTSKCTPLCVVPSACSMRVAQHAVRIRSPTIPCRPNVAPAGRAKSLQVVAFRESNNERPAASVPPQPARKMSISEHVFIAVDYYRLLQVPRVSRADAIRRAYETLVKQPPATAYTADTLFSRAVLLKAAAEALTDPDLRRSYDAKLAAGYNALRVGQQDLPGTLVVLQEIGEFQLVLDHGCQWLELNGNQLDAGDVAAAVALAYCDRAGERLAASAAQGAVLPACDDLDAALTMLRRYGMAKQLQGQIVEALHDLSPEYACELLALPLGPDKAARRAKGLMLMRGVLKSAAMMVRRGGPSAAYYNDALNDPQSIVGHAWRMLRRSRDALTCGEQVALLPDALRVCGTMPNPDVLYDGALAYIVEGYRNGWPHFVHQADQLLQRLEDVLQRQTAERERRERHEGLAAARSALRGGAATAAVPAADPTLDGGLGRDDGDEEEMGAAGPEIGGDKGQEGEGVSLERAMCAVLMGDYTAAVNLLGLTDGGVNVAVAMTTATEEEGVATSVMEDGAAAAAPSTAAAQLRSFIMEHTPEDANDMRPGLRVLTARWLEGVALASFRDTAAQSAMPLETSWFSQPRVSSYLWIWGICRENQHMLEVAHFLCNLMFNLRKFMAAIAFKIAAVATLVAGRLQRVATVLGSVATSSSKSKKRTYTSVGGVAATRISPQAGKASASGTSRRQLPTNSGTAPAPASSPAAATSVATAPPIEAAASVGAVGLPVVSTDTPSCPSSDAAPRPSGQPNAKALRDSGSATTTGTIATATASTAAGVTAVRPTPRVVNPVAMRVSRSLGASSASSASAATNTQDRIRRRFAASAAVDAGESVMPSQLDADAHHHEDEADQEAEPQAEALTVPYDLGDGSGQTGRRAVTEEDLRAHLAGLEAAMWDSEVPSNRPSLLRTLLRVVGTLSVLAALFYVAVFQRNSATISIAAVCSAHAKAVAAPVAVAPVAAVASISGSSFAPTS